MNKDLVNQESKHVKLEDHDKREDDDDKHDDDTIKPKKIKQFVIVKEYNGSFYPQKKTKREYTQKTILKEQLPKSERNSLNFLDIEHEKNMKFVTLVDLPSISENDNSVKKNNTVYENIQRGALISLLTVGGIFGAYTIIKNKGD
jgi:hypothetical protein